MKDGQGEGAKFPDPFGPFREVRDSYLDAMAKVMVGAVNSEEYARVSGAMLDGYLTLAAPIRQALEASMVHALEKLSLPSRQELATLASRFTNFEMRLDDLDAKLDSIARAMQAAQAPPPSDKQKAQAAPAAETARNAAREPAGKAARKTRGAAGKRPR